MFVAVDYNSPLIKIVSSESQGTSHFKVSKQSVIAHTCGFWFSYAMAVRIMHHCNGPHSKIGKMLLYLLWLSLRYQTINSNTVSINSMNYFTYFTSSFMLYFTVYNKSATFGIILSHAPWKGHSFWNLCVWNYYSFKHGVSTNHLTQQ
jgi:hypothetical protein